jgi:hypothetical protein
MIRHALPYVQQLAAVLVAHHLHGSAQEVAQLTLVLASWTRAVVHQVKEVMGGRD